ncbi:hypothetical protein IB276_26025 [Ensifer sp. ENS04]|uniref:hypothetical protein n=1 Tax=Ensifer sp. ENS04 TaxID=2769281 RepID=UPI00177CC820|nr:hypothetical protein [Ensifer sp. ENS04]MBD9542908.1 hypothetical protein [Ensifer sp. ENS04]
MTLSSNASVDEMFAMRQSGASIEEIAARAGLKFGTAYQRLRRQFGAEAIKRENLPGPANDNNPHRVTRMTARNGGCSTVSGMMPVSLARVPTVDGHAEQVAA